MYNLLKLINTIPLELLFVLFCTVLIAIYIATRNPPPDPTLDDDGREVRDPHTRPTPPSARTGDPWTDTGYTPPIPAFLLHKDRT